MFLAFGSKNRIQKLDKHYKKPFEKLEPIIWTRWFTYWLLAIISCASAILTPTDQKIIWIKDVSGGNIISNELTNIASYIAFLETYAISELQNIQVFK